LNSVTIILGRSSRRAPPRAFLFLHTRDQTWGGLKQLNSLCPERPQLRRPARQPRLSLGRRRPSAVAQSLPAPRRTVQLASVPCPPQRRVAGVDRCTHVRSSRRPNTRAARRDGDPSAIGFPDRETSPIHWWVRLRQELATSLLPAVPADFRPMLLARVVCP